MLSLNVRTVCVIAGHPYDPARIMKRGALLGLLLIAPIAARAEDLAIPPGQEQLIATMLGRDVGLPGGCDLVDVGAEFTMIQATYECVDGPIAIELVHASKASAASTQTAKFAIRLRSGLVPPGFAPGLVSLVRSQEHAFRWKVPSSEHEGIVDDDGQAN